MANKTREIWNFFSVLCHMFTLTIESGNEFSFSLVLIKFSLDILSLNDLNFYQVEMIWTSKLDCQFKSENPRSRKRNQSTFQHFRLKNWQHYQREVDVIDLDKNIIKRRLDQHRWTSDYNSKNLSLISIHHAVPSQY